MAGGLDFEALRHAIEQSDAESPTSFYAKDVEMLTVNRNSTPSSLEVLRGKEAIAEYLRHICGRDMTHRVENEVVGQDCTEFKEACEYPDGLQVLAETTLDVQNGYIVRQVNVETWDE